MSETGFRAALFPAQHGHRTDPELGAEIPKGCPSSASDASPDRRRRQLPSPDATCQVGNGRRGPHAREPRDTAASRQGRQPRTSGTATVDGLGQARYGPGMQDATLPAMNVRDDEPQPLVVPLSLDGSEALTFDVGEDGRGVFGGATGWAAFHSPAVTAAGVSVRFRFGPTSDDKNAPIQIKEMQVSLTSRRTVFDSPLFRTIPFQRILAAVNRPLNRERIRPLLLYAGAVETQRLPGSGLMAWDLPPREPVKAQRPNLRVRVPSGTKRPDSFYAQVADAYLAQATISARPAQDLALSNAVPPSTVHRWLKEARARGLLALPGVGDWTSSERLQ